MDCELIVKSFFTFSPTVVEEYTEHRWNVVQSNTGWYISPPDYPNHEPVE